MESATNPKDGVYAFVCLYKACVFVNKGMPVVCVCVCVSRDTWVYSISSVAACRLQEGMTIFFFMRREIMAQGRCSISTMELT